MFFSAKMKLNNTVLRWANRCCEIRML